MGEDGGEGDYGAAGGFVAVLVAAVAGGQDRGQEGGEEVEVGD